MTKPAGCFKLAKLAAELLYSPSVKVLARGWRRLMVEQLAR